MSPDSGGITRTSGIRRAEPERQSALLGLVTDHVIAKLVALLFAGVIIMLIDRELTGPLVDSEFDVRIAGAADDRSAAGGGRRAIILEPEPGVAVQSLDQRRTRVTITGMKKISDQLKGGNGLIGHVALKADWLTRDAQGVSRTPRKIEGKDVDFGVAGISVTLSPSLQIELDPEVERVLHLSADPKDVAPGLVAEVTFEPAVVRVLGPRSWFQGSGAIDQVAMPVSCAGKTERFTDPVTVLPDELVQKQIRLAPSQQIVATVGFKKGEDATLNIEQVALKLMSSAVTDYKFALQAPLDGPNPVVSVKLTGNRAAVARYRTSPGKDELRGLLAWINTDAVMAKAGPALAEQPPDGVIEAADVKVTGIPDDLKVVAITPDKVDVKVLKK